FLKIDYEPIRKTWVSYVEPRGETYTKPLVILVGRWTAGMAESMAIGLEAMGRAQILGTEMKGFAGTTRIFKFPLLNTGFRICVDRRYHLNGTPLEDYRPTHYFIPTQLNENQILKKMAIEMIK
ncbi:MAG: S41 family peptidase, partial [Bacteroidota bacterium]